MNIVLSHLAEADLEDLTLYGLINFGPTVARKYFDSLNARIKLLASHPEMGRSVETRTNGICRMLVHQSHVVLYRIDPSQITIIRILDARQNWRALRLD